MIKEKLNFKFKTFTFLLLFFSCFISFSTSAQECPVVGSDGVFDTNTDIIITSYHQSMAKIATGLVVWGEDMDSDGVNDTNGITEVTPVNGYNYTGSIIHYAISGNTGGQAFLATTTNLYAWGTEGEVVSANFTSGTAFDVMSLTGPSGQAFNSNEIVDMHATSDAIFVLLNNGTVWVATNNLTAPNGNTNTNSAVWQQVQTALNTPLTGVTQVTGSKISGYALTESGTIYAWGTSIELGNGGLTENFSYATPMTAAPSAIKYITTIFHNDNESGLLALGTDKKVYGVGANTLGKIIDTGTGNVNTWTAIKKDATTDLTGVLSLTASHTSEEWSGAGVIVEADGTSSGLPYIYVWGHNNLNSIAGSEAVSDYPIIPASFTKGTDDPSYISVGGHAITYFNRASGSICFAGHITNNSTGGLTTGDGSSFECIIPTNVELCGLQSIQPQKDSGSVRQDIGGTAIANVVANDVLKGTFSPTIGSGAGEVTLTQTSSSNAGIVLSTTTGAITVTSAVLEGTYTLIYELCESGASPANCNSAVATIEVIFDNDDDGISDDDDLDDDNDGIKDTDEGKCTPPVVTGGNAFSASQIIAEVKNPGRAVDGVDGNPAQFKVNNATMQVVLRSGSAAITSGTVITIVARIRNANTGNKMFVSESTDGSTFGSEQEFTFATNNVYYTKFYVLTTNATHLRIRYQLANNNLEVDNVSYPNFEIPCASLDTDKDGVEDYLDLDSDNDGITDVIEAGGTDANNDGFADGNQGTTTLTRGIPTSAGTGLTPPNTDGTGSPDYLDIDSDDDGIPDNIEGQSSSSYTAPSGISTAMNDTNNNGLDDKYEPLGGYATVGFVPVNTDLTDNPDYLDLDSDNDAVLDILENGDANISLAGTDADGDGLDDNFDDNNDSSINGFTVNDGIGTGNKVTNATTLETAYGDEDADFNPGTGDVDYRDIRDADNDGIADFYDLDNDNDGILDTNETPGNVDPDLDSDNDGIPNFKDPDTGPLNANGIVATFDTDSDGISNHEDTDSDNDGCADAVEAAGDIQISQLTTLTGGSNGGNSGNLGIISDAEGNPIVNVVGYEQLSTAALLDVNDNTACFIDLNLIKTVDKSIVKINDIAIFTITLTNIGNLNATGVSVKDILPSGLIYNAGASTVPANTTYTAGTGLWDLTNLTIVNGQTIVLKIAATVTTTKIKLNTTEIVSTNQTDIDSIPNSTN